MPTEDEFFSLDYEGEDNSLTNQPTEEEEAKEEDKSDEDQLSLPLEEETSDEPEEQAEDESVPETEAYQAPREKELSRGEKRFQQLANKAKKAEDETADLRRQLDELRNRRNDTIDYQRNREYQQWFDSLSPEAKFMETARIQAENATAEVNRLRSTVVDSQDKSDFHSYLAFNPQFQKYSQEVEDTLKEVRASGVDAKRGAILRYILGLHMERHMVQSKPVSRKVAQNNVKRQTTRVARTSANVSSDRRVSQKDNMSIEALEERLRGKSLGDIWGPDA